MRLSGPREWTSAVHVLVVGERTDDGREWLVEHPPECPTFCPWYPAVRDGLFGAQEGLRGGVEYGCLVGGEIAYGGIDSLTDPETGRAWWEPFRGGSLAETLPAGRYLVECWYHNGAGQGEYGGQGDPDSAFTLLGPETPPGLRYRPDLLLPHRAFTGHFRWPR